MDDENYKGPPKETQFKKGQPTINPAGRRGKDPMRTAIKHITLQELRDVLSISLSGDIGGLREAMRDPKISVLKAMVCSAAIKAITNGDWNTIDAMLSRIIGRTPNALAIKSFDTPLNAPQIVRLMLPANGRTREENEPGND